jgi:hypothetical protein
MIGSGSPLAFASSLTSDGDGSGFSAGVNASSGATPALAYIAAAADFFSYSLADSSAFFPTRAATREGV